MAKKQKKTEEGAPAWMVTFGDMMALLLCFFVMLVAMSEIKEEDKYKEVVHAIQKAFGYRGGMGLVPGVVSPANTIDMRKSQLLLRKFQMKIGKSTDQGIEGPEPSVKTIREGMEYVVGGLIAFEQGKARLLGRGKAELDLFVQLVHGMNTKIRIKGHAARKPKRMYQPYATLDELSYARAQAVKQYLITKGIRPERLTCEACGTSEPLETEAYDEKSRAKNRRVSLIVTEMLVEDYHQEKPPHSGEFLDG